MVVYGFITSENILEKLCTTAVCYTAFIKIIVMTSLI